MSKRIQFFYFFISVSSVLFVKATVVTCLGTTTDITSDTNYSYMGISMSSSTNGMASFVGYPFRIFCTNLAANPSTSYVSTTTGCGAGQLPLYNVSTTSVPFTNAHIEDPSVGLYSRLICLDIGFEYSYATVTSKLSNCDGYGTTLFSAPLSFLTTGNSHIGGANAYIVKRCMTLIRRQSISIAYSVNSVGFGNLSSSQTRYATSDGLGTTTSLTATSSSFFIDVNTTGNTGYVVSLEGATLTNQNSLTKTIAKIGAVPTELTPGIEQFGISATTTCVNPNSTRCSSALYNKSSISYPYNTSNYAYTGDAGILTTLGNGERDDGLSSYGGSRFHIKLGANIAPLTPAGTYITNLTVIVTSEF